MSDAAASKVRQMSQADIPIAERRALYNGMARRVKSGIGLKPGLVQKYNACISSKKERFAMLKEFIIDESMWGPQTFRKCIVMFVFKFEFGSSPQRLVPSVCFKVWCGG